MRGKGRIKARANVVCIEAGAIHNWQLSMHRLIFWHSERYINYILSAYTNTVISMPDLDIVQKHFLTQGFPGNSGFPCCRKSNKQELFSSNYNRFSLCYLCESLQFAYFHIKPQLEKPGRYIFGCYNSSFFYIKPQRYGHYYWRSYVVIHPFSTSNHNLQRPAEHRAEL